MEVVIGSLIEGAQRASGNVAVIDVLRAFTTAAVALANGASQITMVGTVEEALALRAQGMGKVCMGEVHGLKPQGFDFGNSPTEIRDVDFRGVPIIQRTSSGTQGIVAAANAVRLYAASLVTATATARALARGGPQRITLVAMGFETISRADEDELCAIHLRSILEGRTGDGEAVRRLAQAGAGAARFLDPASPEFPRADLEVALDIDRYDFAVRVTTERGRPVARAERTA